MSQSRQSVHTTRAADTITQFCFMYNSDMLAWVCKCVCSEHQLEAERGILPPPPAMPAGAPVLKKKVNWLIGSEQVKQIMYVFFGLCIFVGLPLLI